jgi:hypothetical protein
MGRDYGDHDASSSLFESISLDFFHLRHQVRLLKFYSSLWPFYICNKPSVALEFFLLDETSRLQNLEDKKNLKVSILYPEKYKPFDVQFLKGFLEIQYYYCIAKKHINEKGAKKGNKIDLESELKRIQSFKLIQRSMTIDIDFYKCINGDSTGWVIQQD